MGDPLELSRRSLRQDQILELHFPPWPEPSPEMMKLPGVSAWWTQMRISRERDIQSFHRLVNNLQISSNQTGTP